MVDNEKQARQFARVIERKYWDQWSNHQPGVKTLEDIIVSELLDGCWEPKFTHEDKKVFSIE